MHNVLCNLGQCSAAPQDTKNSDSDMIDTGGVLPRGMERSAPLEIDLSPVDTNAAAANEGDYMSVGGASVDGAPAGNITHQYAADLSLEEADL